MSEPETPVDPLLLSREELTHFVAVFNRVLRQFPRIAGDIVNFSCVTSAEEICSTVKQDCFGGRLPLSDGSRPVYLGFDYGPHFNPAYVRLNHLLAAMCREQYTNVKLVWEAGLPRLEVV